MKYLITSAFLILVSESLGQKLLFHKNKYKEVFYEVGETITFQLKGDNSKHSAKIQGFEKNLIVFSDFKLNPEEISHIYVDKKTRTWFVFRYKYKSVFLMIGLGYIVLDVLNTGSLSKETAVFGGTFIMAAILAKLLISEKIKIRGKRKLVITNYATHSGSCL